MQRKLIYVLIIILLIISGCAVEEFSGSGEPNGSLYVTTADNSGNEISGASIILDGIERPERTPAWLHGVLSGSHNTIIRLYGFFNDTTSFNILGGDTVTVQSVLTPVPIDQTGLLGFDSQPEGARLLINGSSFQVDDSPVLTPGLIPIAWGDYNVSVHKPGYATVSPLLPLVRIIAGETNAISFNLEARETGTSEGYLPHSFTLENVEGDSICLTDLTGYVVLMNFWYGDCVPCMNEFSGIDSVFQSYAEDGFRVLAVNPMYPDDRERVIQVRDELGLTFQLLLDWGQNVTARLYNVRRFPHNVIISRTGVIHSVHGGLTQAELKTIISPLLD
ncbi:MAG: TlpA disulfide reductase family protein [Candidatus Hatepunaea meridiana]|nr:TlpA disulfide reductase family protein [Candidatus Hatepunaea meridiana]